MGKNTSGGKYISLEKNMEFIDFLAESGCFNDFPGVQVVNDSSSNCVYFVCNNINTLCEQHNFSCNIGRV
jgi:hypothetical protein